MKKNQKNFILLCILSFLVYFMLGLIILPKIVAYTTPEDSNVAMILAIAACVFGGAGGIAVAVTGSAAISALAEKPEIFIRAFMVVSLAEAVALYGLLLGILIIGGLG